MSINSVTAEYEYKSGRIVSKTTIIGQQPEELIVPYTEDSQGSPQTLLVLKAEPSSRPWPGGKPLWKLVAPEGAEPLPVSPGERFTYLATKPGEYIFTAECGNTLSVIVWVVKVDLEIYKPKVIDPDEGLIPEEEELEKGGVTFENLDNDDKDEYFDNKDTQLKGGDNELVRIMLKITPKIKKGLVKIIASAGGDYIRIWEEDEKVESYSIAGDYEAAGALQIAGFEEKGEYLVKELWVEGITAHNMQRQTRLAMGYFCDTTEPIGEDEVALTILGIEVIEWIGRGNSIEDRDELTEDPNWPDGMAPGAVRVFPGARLEGGVVGEARDKVDVKVTLTTAPPYTVKIYLRSFDVDDPTADKGPVDDPGRSSNEQEAEDNRGEPREGTFTGELEDWVTGIKALEFEANQRTQTAAFQVTMQPGDNFRVVGSGDKWFLAQLENNDKKQNTSNADKQRICVKDEYMKGMSARDREVREPDRYCSNVLTVWRFLHVEMDSMGMVVNNNARGKVIEIKTSFVGNNRRKVVRIDSEGLSLNTEEAKSLDDGSKDLGPPPTGNGRFENGTLRIGTRGFGVKANGDLFLVMAEQVTVPFTISKGNKVRTGNIIRLSVIGKQSLITADITMRPGEFKGGQIEIEGVTYQVSRNSYKGILTEKGEVVRIDFVLHDDDVDRILPKLPYIGGEMKDIFKPAYILPIGDGAGNKTNKRKPSSPYIA